MKILFSKQGKSCYVADKERVIFCIDNAYFDINGNEVPDEEAFHKNKDNDGWYRYWMDYEGLPEPLEAETTIEPEWEIDDVFGKFGFKNQAGKFIIEPQYACAHDFTCGLASVNLNRTWYKTPDGHRCYENHYGYIDSTGKTVIGFQYDEARPFNKYGVAVVTKNTDNFYHLIDLEGNEIPDTRFPDISYYDYNDRYLEFSRDDDEEALIGLYDTKERKVLIEPRFREVSVTDDNHILVWERDGEYGESDFRQYYINGNGELIYPWLSKQRFAIVEIPDINDVAAVAISQYIELAKKHSGSYFPHNDKKYERKFVYGLYSSKEEFLLPLEYEKIEKLTDDIWGCCKEGVITIVKTEPTD
ncbi:MAG: WG repeat-containing protein [Ruminococcaceae bacterium]|nr:WG repeat-containing protein [Oscillospiraceae bacterium]